MENTLLGQTVSYSGQYDPSLLFPIPRDELRSQLAHSQFFGFDIWTAYEVSWLDPKGKPQVCMIEIEIPANSPNLVESKSLKLYLNSFNQTSFKDKQFVGKIIASDLARCCGSDITLSTLTLEPIALGRFSGTCLDNLDVEIDTYLPDPGLLRCNPGHIKETVYTDLFRSTCPITGQPDWASICIHYTGQPIDHESLLKYLVSYRNHTGFHEHCTEEIFSDLIEYCKCEQLQIYARFTRRGGIDINCYRSTDHSKPNSARLARQ